MKSILPEVLAPVGDRERLEFAVRYGADAVYLGARTMGLRASAANFDFPALKSAAEFAHSHGVKVYLTCNVLPNNREIPLLPEFFLKAQDAGVDALIIADIGVLLEAKRVVPDMALHVSTQTGVVNYLTAGELYRMGASRVVLARELSLEDIRQIRDNTPPELELEAFVHGAMCVSFSGRCLLSQYLTGRDANRGECAQPCRWSYHLMEEKRPGQFLPVFEEEGATFILNAKDLSMISHIDKLAKAGVTSFKIEGRAKSFYYVAVVTNAYRQAVDLYGEHPEDFRLPAWLEEETRKVSHRQYCTGFYFGPPEDGQYTQGSGYVRSWDVAAVVEGPSALGLCCTQRNKFSPGQRLELLSPGKKPVSFAPSYLLDGEGRPIPSANKAVMRCIVPAPPAVLEAAVPGSILRRESAP